MSSISWKQRELFYHNALNIPNCTIPKSTKLHNLKRVFTQALLSEVRIVAGRAVQKESILDHISSSFINKNTTIDRDI